MNLPMRSCLKLPARLFAAIALLAASAALAQGYPDKPIRIINPFPPGSPVEFVGRLAAESGEHTVVKPVTHGFTWLDLGGIRLGAGAQIDGLAVTVMFVVTLVSLLVHVYSTEYMRDDRRYKYAKEPLT